MILPIDTPTVQSIEPMVQATRKLVVDRLQLSGKKWLTLHELGKTCITSVDAEKRWQLGGCGGKGTGYTTRVKHGLATLLGEALDPMSDIVEYDVGRMKIRLRPPLSTIPDQVDPTRITDSAGPVIADSDVGAMATNVDSCDSRHATTADADQAPAQDTQLCNAKTLAGQIGGEVPMGSHPLDICELPAHPEASVFPMMTGKAFEDLKDDIRQRGQQETIWVYQGRVVDGRNRYRACRDLGLEPRTREWDGNGSLLDFVVSMNLHRRHLSESQRADLGAQLMERYAEEGDARKEKTVANLPPRGRSRDRVAEAVNVSPRTVQAAIKVRKQGAPGLVDAMKQNQIAVSAAANLADLPVDEQEDVLARGPEAVKKKTAQIRIDRKKQAPQKTKQQPVLPPGEREPTGVPDAIPTAGPATEDDVARIIELLLQAETLAARVTSRPVTATESSMLRNTLNPGKLSRLRILLEWPCTTVNG